MGNPDAGMPCRLCGAARSCDYRTVAAPVPPVEKTQPNAHKKNLKVGQERKSGPDTREYSASGTLLKTRKALSA
jgi:hypothetical protein